MERKFVFSKIRLMYFLLMWIISFGNVTCQEDQLCPETFHGGYIRPSCSRVPGCFCLYKCNPGFIEKHGRLPFLTCGENGLWSEDTSSVCTELDKLCPAKFNGGYIEPSCQRLPGDICTYSCNPGLGYTGDTLLKLTCGENGKWNEDTNSFCIDSATRGKQVTNVGPIAGAVIGTISIIAIIAGAARRSSIRKSQRRVPGHTISLCSRPRENPEQHVTITRQQPNTNSASSLSSSEPHSYNGPCVHSSMQRIPTIFSSCRHTEPPPSYRETHNTPNESPPTYKEVVEDPSRFNLYI